MASILTLTITGQVGVKKIVKSHLSRIGNWEGLAASTQYYVPQLAVTCRCSVRQLERYFQEAFQETPQQWLDKLRLVKSANLLEQGASVKEVAAALHFSNSSHFIRHFKKRYQCTPMEFVAHAGKKIKPPITHPPITKGRKNVSPA